LALHSTVGSEIFEDVIKGLQGNQGPYAGQELATLFDDSHRAKQDSFVPSRFSNQEESLAEGMDVAFARAPTMFSAIFWGENGFTVDLEVSVPFRCIRLA